MAARHGAHVVLLGDHHVVEIRVLAVADVAAFWSVRLRALALHPEAFGTAFEDEQHVSWTDVCTRFCREWTADGGFVLGAFDGPEIAGTLGLRRRPGAKRRHVAEIWGVWVDPARRRQGLGRALATAAIARAKTLPDLEQIELSVGMANDQARRLYASLGFEPYGVAPRALKVGGRHLDEELMALNLRTAELASSSPPISP